VVKPARHTANNKLHDTSDAVCTVPATAVSKHCARSGYESIVSGLTGAIYLKHEVDVKALQFLRGHR
jgi:hypothetical protein